MKRMILSIMLLSITTLIHAQTATLDIALSGARSYIESRLPRGNRVLIADLAAPGRELGIYAAQELSTRLVNGNRLVVVERSAAVMRTISAETTYQMSGDVSDDTIQSIGHQTGAESVVTGIITGVGDRFRLNIKITAVRTAELLGQYSVFFQPDIVLNSLLANSRPARTQPRWINEPLSVRATYETNPGGVSQWFYDVGVSNRAASEQLARTRARQNIQHSVAENIASDMRARIDITSLSAFAASEIEDTETRIEAALTNTIRTRVPSFEVLEWHTETGMLNGREFHMAYVLVRFPRHEIFNMVEKLEPEAIANNVIRQTGVFPTADHRDELIRELTAVRDHALQTIREGNGVN